MGSITIYLPFIDDVTRKTIDALIHESKNHSDFVSRICRRVLEKNSDPMLVYLAYRYAGNSGDKNCRYRISQKYGRRHLLIPEWIEDAIDDLDEIAHYVEEVLSTDPEPWVAYHMYDLLAERARTNTLGSVDEEIALDRMQQLLDLHQELAPFEASLLSKRSEILKNDGQCERALDLVGRAIDLVTRYDDLVSLWLLHARIAYYINVEDPLRALNHLEVSRRIREELGLEPIDTYSILNVKALVHSVTGEYDAALDYYLKTMDQIQVPDTNIGVRYLPANVAYLYNRMGRHLEALEYAKMALELRSFTTDTGAYRPYAHCHMAMSLAGLGRIGEAIQHLATARELTMKTGSDSMIALCHFTSGYIHRAEGNLASAMQSFEDTLGLDIPRNRMRTLYELTRIEVEMFTLTEENSSDEISGPWMQRFEEEASEGYKPGFVGLALLLKAELRRKQGRQGERDQLLRKVQRMAEDPTICFLRDLLIQYIRIDS